DEDAVSLAVEAARDAVRGGIEPDTLLFATLSPPYAEKLNAATIQAALDLPPQMIAADLGGSARAGLRGLPPRVDPAGPGAAGLGSGWAPARSRGARGGGRARPRAGAGGSRSSRGETARQSLAW